MTGRRNSLLARFALLASIGSMGLAVSACAGSSGTPELTESRKEELSKRWRLYLQQDPKWPAAREEWLSGPAHERQLLLDNLLIELLRDDAAGRGSGTTVRSSRARAEFTWFGSDAIPFLVEAMRALCDRDPVDVIAVDRVGLALVDLHATKDLVELSVAPPGTSAEDPSRRVRFAAVHALTFIEEPASTAALAQRVNDDPAWQVRGAAADALRKRVHEVDARAALIQALSDADGYVRAQAVRALVVGLNPDEDVGALDRVLTFLLQDPAPEARGAAAESLELIAFDPRVERALTLALRDPDLNVMLKAARALMNTRSTPTQLALVDALERAVKQRQDGIVSELLIILQANVGSKPRNINPAGWRELIQATAKEH